MLLPTVVTLVPTYVIFRDLGWVNTYLPLVVPAFLGTPYYVFLFRQFFLRIPESMSEAARIDGASELWIYARIIMPVSRPVVAAVAVLAFVQAWTDYLGPLIYLNNQSQWTLSLGLTAFLTKYSVEWNYMMAASVVFTLPLVIVFFVGNKYILSGISFTTDVG
jgi:multiple sugar transport system permease protein